MLCHCLHNLCLDGSYRSRISITMHFGRFRHKLWAKNVKNQQLIAIFLSRKHENIFNSTYSILCWFNLCSIFDISTHNSSELAYFKPQILMKNISLANHNTGHPLIFAWNQRDEKYIVSCLFTFPMRPEGAVFLLFKRCLLNKAAHWLHLRRFPCDWMMKKKLRLPRNPGHMFVKKALRSAGSQATNREWSGTNHQRLPPVKEMRSRILKLQ